MLRKSAIAIALIMLASSISAAQWEIDKPHSSVGFTVRHLVVSKVNGTFGDFKGSIEFEPGNFEKGRVEMTVQIASIDTNEPKRDAHLRSGDFFDAENFPTMTFVSKRVHDIEGDSFKMTGDLTIRGITKEITFDCEFNGLIADPWGNTRAGFSAASKLNRQDFDVKWNQTLDAGGVVVGDEVTINIELELTKLK